MPRKASMKTFLVTFTWEARVQAETEDEAIEAANEEFVESYGTDEGFFPDSVEVKKVGR